jgi:hypothetical protein
LLCLLPEYLVLSGSAFDQRQAVVTPKTSTLSASFNMYFFNIALLGLFSYHVAAQDIDDNDVPSQCRSVCSKSISRPTHVSFNFSGLFHPFEVPSLPLTVHSNTTQRHLHNHNSRCPKRGWRFRLHKLRLPSRKRSNRYREACEACVACTFSRYATKPNEGRFTERIEVRWKWLISQDWPINVRGELWSIRDMQQCLGKQIHPNKIKNLDC